MKLGLLGDCHFTNRSPERRKDDYFQTQLNKFEEAIQIFSSAGCDLILQVGDFFDSSTVSNRVKSVVISLLKKYNVKIYCVAGQHDIVGHSLGTYANSPLAVLEAAGSVKLIGKESFNFSLGETSTLNIYGTSFGEEVPVTEYSCKERFNILIIHEMIGDRELYPGQELQDPIRFLKKYPNYQLVVCGDYHYRFIQQFENRVIINPGCLVRKTISKWDLEHKPAVVIFDTKTMISEVVELTCKPVEEVFDLSRKLEITDNSNVLSFIENLKTSCSEKATWKDILVQILRERNCSELVKNIIDDILLRIKNE